jgi:hypothetical protein
MYLSKLPKKSGSITVRAAPGEVYGNGQKFKQTCQQKVGTGKSLYSGKGIVPNVQLATMGLFVSEKN